MNRKHHLINSRLFQKYCQSQNYYYTRDINDILSEATTRGVVKYKDCNCYDEQDEYLKRLYFIAEYPSKIALLTEYYKFHNDIPRIFQEPVASMLNKYYDKKRKYEYYRIAKLIEEENKNNPHKPPKGIVGDKPSPLNSQESQQNEDQELPECNLKDIQILKELSWLTKLEHQIDKPVRIKLDVSQTLNEICKQIGNFTDQSSLYLPQNVKTEEVKLDNFLLYLNKKQQNQKQTTKLSQPQEQLIQSLLQLQTSKTNLTKKPEINYLLKTQNTETQNRNINFVKNQIDYLNKKQVSNKMSIDENATKIDSKLSESVKQKSKTNIQIKPFNNLNQKNTSPTPQLTSKMSLGSFTHIKTQQSLHNQPNNHNHLAKILMEDEQVEHDLKWKNGALTHRPVSGTQNFFNSNRNSPSLKKIKFDNFKFQKAKTQHQPYTKIPTKPNSRKTTSQNIHIRQTSNQDRIITINQDQFRNNKHLFTEIPIQTHKKNMSDSRGLYQKDFFPIEYCCLTERGPNIELLFKTTLTQQSSPKSQHFKPNGPYLKQNSSHHKGTLISQMIQKVAKQNQQLQINKIQQKHS